MKQLVNHYKLVLEVPAIHLYSISSVSSFANFSDFFIILFQEFQSTCVNDTELLENSCLRIIKTPNNRIYYLIIQPFLKCDSNFKNEFCFEKVYHSLRLNENSTYNFSSTSSDDIFSNNLSWKILEIDKNRWTYRVNL